MKKLSILLIVMIGFISGCVAYPVPYQGGHREYRGDGGHHGGYRHAVPHRRDRDGDGVRNRRDYYPNDPRRY